MAGCHYHAMNLGLASVLINAIKIPSLEESLGNSQFDEGRTRSRGGGGDRQIGPIISDVGAEITQSFTDLPKAKVVGGW